MKRRLFLSAAALAGLGGLAWRYWPLGGWSNACLERLPSSLATHPLVEAAWEGIAADQVWDSHVHLIGTGDGDTGIWVNPDMDSPLHPIQWLQKRFYLDAACVNDGAGADHEYVRRLLHLHDQLPPGTRLLLLAFDWFHDDQGRRRPELSSFHTPNRYARQLAMTHPAFEWIASIHPYREDATERLQAAIAAGARAVKWLPAAQGMDPADPRCDPFYAVLARHDIPLLVHVGAELAVLGGNTEDFGNPLRLRRPLAAGVRVIAAHCASLGESVDLDRGASAAKVDSFTLFTRLMDETRETGRLYGELSGLTQINRRRPALRTALARDDWHPRLLNASDYPLPGIPPLFSLRQLVRDGLLDREAAAILAELRQYNPLLFDFVCKRSLRLGDRRFAPVVFETRRVFEPRASTGQADA